MNEEEKIYNCIMENKRHVSLSKDYPIKEILSIINEKDKFRVSFILVFRAESYGRGISKKLFIKRIESKYPYTCLVESDMKEIKNFIEKEGELKKEVESK